MRLALLTASALFLLMPADAIAAAPDDANAVIADCSRPDLPGPAVDSCLERARVLDETEPSAALESLEARLQQRQAGNAPGASSMAGAQPEGAVTVAPLDGAPSQLHPDGAPPPEQDQERAESAPRENNVLPEDAAPPPPPPPPPPPAIRGPSANDPFADDLSDEPPVTDPPDTMQPYSQPGDAPPPSDDPPQ